MSEINENIKEIDTQINNLKESIKQKKNDIEQLLGQQTTLTDTPQKAIIQNRILQKQNQIKQNKQQLKTLKQIKQNLDKSQQIISKNNQQEEQGQIYDGDKIPTPNDEYIPKPTPEQEDKEDKEEQGEIYDGNKIPTPDDEYIPKPKPTPEQEDKDEEDKDEEDKDEQDENEVINKAQLNGPREIEMSKLGNPIMTRKYRGTLPQGRLKTLKPLQKQLTRRKSISNAGFSETIIQKLNRPTGPMTINMKICPTILDTGKKVNNKYFIPSQFPNLTKPKQLVQNISKKSNTKQKKTLKKIKKLNKTKNK